MSKKIVPQILHSKCQKLRKLLSISAPLRMLLRAMIQFIMPTALKSRGIAINRLIHPSQLASRVLNIDLSIHSRASKVSLYIPQILFAEATIISALASSFFLYRSASVGCSWLFCALRGFTWRRLTPGYLRQPNDIPSSVPGQGPSPLPPPGLSSSETHFLGAVVRSSPSHT